MLEKRRAKDGKSSKRSIKVDESLAETEGAKDRNQSKSSKREHARLEKMKAKGGKCSKRLIEVDERLAETEDNEKVVEHRPSKVDKVKKMKLKSNKKRRREKEDHVEANNADKYRYEAECGANKIDSTGDSTENAGQPETPCDVGCPSEAKSMRKIKAKKGKKGVKRRREELCAVNEDGKLDEHIGDDEETVNQISAVDEDCSRGMKKWIRVYKERRPGLKILQQRIDDFITEHEQQQQQARKEREALVAEDGWTVVVHHKGRKKTTDSESGTTMGSVAQAAVLDKMGKKKSNEVALDFYSFQKRDAKRKEIVMLQSKFEQDKKRIQELRAARKFKPY